MDLPRENDSIPKPRFNNTRELRSDDGPLKKHSILNKFMVESSRGEEEKTLDFEGVSGVVAEEVIRELDRVERIPKRITYNSPFKTLRVVIMSHKVHEVHLPWLTDEIKVYPQPLTLQKKRSYGSWRPRVSSSIFPCFNN